MSPAFDRPGKNQSTRTAREQPAFNDDHAIEAESTQNRVAKSGTNPEGLSS
jgi:hypothetical protein